MKGSIFCISLLSVIPIAGAISAAIALPFSPSQNQIYQNFRRSSAGFPQSSFPSFNHENKPEFLKKRDSNEPLIPWIERDLAQPDCSLLEGKVGIQYRIRDIDKLNDQGKIACVPQEYSNDVSGYLDKQKS